MGVIVIAEAGVNHNGDMALAIKLIDAAVEAGADYVKFQTFKADKLVSEEAKKASYQKENLKDGDDSQYGMLKRLELSDKDHELLKAYAEDKSIKFLSTGFDEDSIDYLEALGIDFFKVPSGEVTNIPYLKHIARKGKPVILSTGMCSLSEIEVAIDVLLQAGMDKNSITVLHCNTQYPTPYQDVNLRAMNTIGAAFQVKVGYSDHTLGIEIPIAAVALGATVIEKHFTLDRTLPGPDHPASLEPHELKSMVSAIRNIEKALSGDGLKKPSPSEIDNRVVVRKSIHVKEEIAKGEIITMEKLIMKRPADGISPTLLELVLNKKANEALIAGRRLQFSDFS
jgi:N,N'-diacetyllegionaminate synthase